MTPTKPPSGIELSVSFDAGCPFQYGTAEYRQWWDTTGKEIRAAELVRARERSLPVKAGTVLLLSEGKYDNYRMEALVRVLTDIDLNALAQQFMPTTSTKYTSNLPHRDGEEFAKWLVAGGYVEMVAYREVQCDDEIDGWVEE